MTTRDSDTGLRYEQEGWVEVPLVTADSSGRRGVWIREEPAKGPHERLELCAGREGDDHYVGLSVGDVVTSEDLTALSRIVTYAPGWTELPTRAELEAERIAQTKRAEQYRKRAFAMLEALRVERRRRASDDAFSRFMVGQLSPACRALGVPGTATLPEVGETISRAVAESERSTDDRLKLEATVVRLVGERDEARAMARLLREQRDKHRSALVEVQEQRTAVGTNCLAEGLRAEAAERDLQAAKALVDEFLNTYEVDPAETCVAAVERLKRYAMAGNAMHAQVENALKAEVRDLRALFADELRPPKR